MIIHYNSITDYCPLSLLLSYYITLFHTLSITLYIFLSLTLSHSPSFTLSHYLYIFLFLTLSLILFLSLSLTLFSYCITLKVSPRFPLKGTTTTKLGMKSRIFLFLISPKCTIHGYEYLHLFVNRVEFRTPYSEY